MPRMSQSLRAVFLLLSGRFLDGGATAPGCDCSLSECCAAMLSDAVNFEDTHLSFLLESRSKIGVLHQETAAPPAACELLVFARDRNATCRNATLLEGSICDALADDIAEHFPDGGDGTALGRFIGQGNCAQLSSATCAAMKMLPFSSRIDQWRRSELLWDDTNETIDFALGLAPPNYRKLQVEQTCDQEHSLAHFKATWLPQVPLIEPADFRPTEPQLAANSFISEGFWKHAGEGSPVKWTCVDLFAPGKAPGVVTGLYAPDDVPSVVTGYYAFYLKIGADPCKPVSGHAALLHRIRQSVLPQFLVFALVWYLCCCLALVIFYGSRSHEEEYDEAGDSDSDEEDLS